MINYQLSIIQSEYNFRGTNVKGHNLADLMYETDLLENLVETRYIASGTFRIYTRSPHPPIWVTSLLYN